MARAGRQRRRRRLAGPGWVSGTSVYASVVAGVLLTQCLFVRQIPLWPIAAALLLWFAVARSAWPGMTLLVLLCTSVSLQWHLADRLNAPPSVSTRVVEGRIDGLPQVHEEYTRFRFKPVSGRSGTQLPGTLLVYWYRDAPALAPGELWRLEMQLSPPWGRVNFQGPDREQWLFAEKIGGLATVRSGRRLQGKAAHLIPWNSMRHAIGLRVVQAVRNEENRAIITALAIADRSKLSTRQRDILRKTGTAHLLAISGLHIGLAAWCGTWFARLLLLLVPLRLSAGLTYPATLTAGVLLAFFYSALAGFGTSTLRALLMLVAGVSAMLLRRSVHPGQAILSALALLLLFDPLAVLSAGFWLSFAAVGVLLLFGTGCRGGRPWWHQLVRAQFSIMLVLLPLSAWWFQSASICGLVANLLAIPFVSLVLVPLILLGMILLPLGQSLTGLCFAVAGGAAGLLLKGLAWLAQLPFAALTLQQPSLPALLLATCGALMILLPRGMRHRWLGLIFLLPLFASDRAPPGGQLQIDVLDVGQGTAVLVSSHSHLLLYDSGPGDGGDYNLVNSVIRPAILRSGHRAPDRILISHADLDHAGGLNGLRAAYPLAIVSASLPSTPEGVGTCEDRLHWKWERMDFQVLHPTPWLPYLGNDSSCVLSIRLPNANVLLPGDISQAVEQRLLRGGLQPLNVLLVPHHGSKTSSTAEFLRATKPAVAVATAGLGNRFGFPHREVRRRYRDEGIPLWSTDACGAVRIRLSADGATQAFSARRARPAPWRWPVGESCP